MVDLASLVRRGHKVDCPACDGRFMSESYRPLHQSGIGQHIRDRHHGLLEQVVAASKQAEQDRKALEAAAAKEARERPLRVHLITGALIDRIIGEVGSLVGMMEPYYAQSNASDSAYDLIEQLEALASSPAQPNITREKDHG